MVNNTTTLIFAERFDRDLLAGGLKIVALNPDVCFELGRRNISYLILEDCLSESELTVFYRMSEKLFNTELLISQELNRVFKEIAEVKARNLEIGDLLFYNLRLLLDPIYIYTKLIEKILDKFSCKSIVYYGYNFKEYIDDRIYMVDNSVFYHVLPVICKNKDIKIINHLLPSPGFRKRVPCSGKTKVIVRQLRFAIDSLLTGIKCKLNGRSKIHANKSVLFIGTDYGVRLWIKDFYKNGWNVFIKKEDEKIYRYSPSAKIEIDFLINKTFNPPREKSMISDFIFDTWKELCGIDFKNLIKPRIDYLFESYIPKLTAFYDTLLSFTEKVNLKYIIYPYLNNLTVNEALVHLGKNSASITNVSGCHGGNVFANLMWDITELRFADIFFANDDEGKEYFEMVTKRRGYQTKIMINVDWLKLSRIRRKSINKRKKRILYAPGFFQETINRLDGAEYTSTWYYRFQLQLIDFLSTLTDYDFIWKGLPTLNSGNISPIYKYITTRKFTNVSARMDSLLTNLKNCDMFLTDNPSSSFYQAAVNKIPVLAFVREGLSIRKGAREFFGKSLTTFQEFNDIKPLIKDFLESDGKQYQVDIKLSDSSLYSKLECCVFQHNGK